MSMFSPTIRLLRIFQPSKINTVRCYSNLNSSPPDTLQQPDDSANRSSSSNSIEDIITQIAPSITPLSAPPITQSGSQPQRVTKIPPSPSWAMRAHPELYDPPVLKPTHRIHVATLVVEAYNPNKEELPVVTGFALQAAYHLGIPVSRPAAMPIKTELHTVLRSGFVHKKSQENFWRLTHRRVIKAYDANEEVVNRWINYLKTDAVKGTNVALKAQRFLYRPIGWGNEVEALNRREAELEALENPISKKKKKKSRSKNNQSDSMPVSEVEASPADAVKALAEKLIEEELLPKAEAHEAMLVSSQTKQGKKMNELETTNSSENPS